MSDTFLYTAKIKDAQAQIANNASSAVGVGATAGSSSSSNSGSSSGNNGSQASQNRDGGSNQANGGSNNNNNSNNGGANSGGTFADANPFVVARDAQRMVLGAYGEDDVARASLEQLNEISRRAAVAGMVFNGNNSANANANGGESASDRLLSVAQNMLASVTNSNNNNNSSSSGGNGSGPNGLAHLSREDTLQRIEELTRNRPSSANQRRADLRPFNSSSSGPSGLSNGGSGGGMNGLLLNGNGIGNNGQEMLPPVVATAPGGGGQYANGSDPFIMPGQETTALEMYAHASSSASSQQQQQQQQQNGGGNGNGGYALTTMQAHQAQAHGLTHSGLQVFTLGHLMPKSALAGEDGGPGAPGGEQGPGMWSLGQQQQQQGQGSPQSSTATYVGDGGSNGAPSGISTLDDDFSSSAGAGPSNAGSSSASASSSSGAGPVSRPGSAKLRVRRSTFVPGWAVPPRVLLVDDDAVNRRLSSKFLQVFGCTIDVAVDGVVAVNKMNLEKYDLVLMVRFSLS